MRYKEIQIIVNRYVILKILVKRYKQYRTVFEILMNDTNINDILSLYWNREIFCTGIGRVSLLDTNILEGSK